MIFNSLLILKLLIHSVGCSFSILTNLANIKKDLFSSLLQSRPNPIKQEILIIPSRPATFSVGQGFIIPTTQQPVLFEEYLMNEAELPRPRPQEFNKPLVQLSGDQVASDPILPPPEEFSKPVLFPDENKEDTLFRENVLSKKFHNKKQRQL